MYSTDLYEIIEPSVEEIIETNPFKKVERCARMCYKTESKITETSCYDFVNRLIKEEHYAILEHARFTFKISNIGWIRTLLNIPSVYIFDFSESETSFFLNISLSHICQPYESCGLLLRNCKKLVDAFYVDQNPLGTISFDCDVIGHTEVEYLAKTLEQDTTGFRTFKFVCDRAVSHELVRHRCSIAQESQRYCNYSLNRFGGKLKFVLPSNWNDLSEDVKAVFLDSFESSSRRYNFLLNSGIKPERARAVLPNATKTEVIMTMPTSQWNHFVDIRSKGTTGRPHPDMKYVADMLAKLL